MEGTYCEELIVTHASRGIGNKEYPFRRVLQIFKKDGTLLAENDSFKNDAGIDLVDILNFSRWANRNGLDPLKLTKEDVANWLDNHRNA